MPFLLRGVRNVPREPPVLAPSKHHPKLTSPMNQDSPATLTVLPPPPSNSSSTTDAVDQTSMASASQWSSGHAPGKMPLPSLTPHQTTYILRHNPARCHPFILFHRPNMTRCCYPCPLPGVDDAPNITSSSTIRYNGAPHPDNPGQHAAGRKLPGAKYPSFQYIPQAESAPGNTSAMHHPPQSSSQHHPPHEHHTPKMTHTTSDSRRIMALLNTLV